MRQINPLHAPVRAPAGRAGQMAFELDHTPSHAEADFTVGEGNQLAFSHICAFPAWPGPFTLIVGPPKSGKSHLARIWAARAGAETVQPGEVEAIGRAGGTVPLVIEDIDRPGYDEAVLFHLINQSMRDKRPLLMTAREPIGAWPYTTDDLRSRARLATHLQVALPGDIELSQMFVKLFGDRQISVDPKIINYIVPRMERSPAEVVELADLMDKMALARGSAINRTIAAEVLAARSADRDEGLARSYLESDADE